MSGEPNPSFSNQLGGMLPPGEYCYPVGFGGSTPEKPVCKFIPYPHTGAGTPQPDNPGDLIDETE